MEIFYPAALTWPSGCGRTGLGISVASIAFLGRSIFNEVSPSEFDNPELFGSMGSLLVSKVAAFAAVDCGDRIALEVLFMWFGTVVIVRHLFDSERDRRALMLVYRGEGRWFASLRPQRQMDVEKLTETTFRVWNYNKARRS
jgi:hypothetical protein